MKTGMLPTPSNWLATISELGASITPSIAFPNLSLALYLYAGIFDTIHLIPVIPFPNQDILTAICYSFTRMDRKQNAGGMTRGICL